MPERPSCNHMNYSKNSILPWMFVLIHSVANTAISHIPDIIASGRAALGNHYRSGPFCHWLRITPSLLFFAPSVTTSIPFVPTLGSLLYLRQRLPFLGFSLTATRRTSNQWTVYHPKTMRPSYFLRAKDDVLSSRSQAVFSPGVVAQIVNLVAFGFSHDCV